LLALHIGGFCTCGFNRLLVENNLKKLSELKIYRLFSCHHSLNSIALFTQHLHFIRYYK
jgi:metal-dependent hydrolase (beta-lactamase superfamily II)